MTNQTKAIPAFADEAEERAYWESHDSTERMTGWKNLTLQLRARD